MTRRSWTGQEQITAEVAAACGVSYAEIGRVLGRASKVVRCRVDVIAATKHKEGSQQWLKTNIDSVKEYRSRYRQANKEKIQEAARKYYQANQEKVKEKKRVKYASNPEKIKEIARKWREANPEKWNQSQSRWKKKHYQVNCEKIKETNSQWRKTNIEKVKEKDRRWYESNIEKALEKNRRRRVRERTSRADALLPLTLAAKDARFALWRNSCAFCGVAAKHLRNHGRKRLSVDHVLALINQGLDESSNIVPACFTCNSSKNATPVEKWYRRQPFFTEARWRKIQRHCPEAAMGQLALTISPPDAEPAP